MSFSINLDNYLTIKMIYDIFSIYSNGLQKVNFTLMVEKTKEGRENARNKGLPVRGVEFESSKLGLVNSERVTLNIYITKMMCFVVLLGETLHAGR